MDEEASGIGLEVDKEYKCADYSSKMLTQMHQQWSERKLCDVTLVSGIDGGKVLAHRLVLAAASEYFATMFAPTFRESREGEIRLQEVHGDVLAKLVDFCYTGKLLINDRTVVKLLTAAQMLQINDAVTACSDFLAGELDATNCAEIATFAEQLSCPELMEAAYKYIDDHFVDFCLTEQILELNFNQLSKIIASDKLAVTSEETVFQAVITWLERNAFGDEQRARELLELVRFPLMDPEFLTTEVKPASLIYGVPELYVEALEWHLMANKNLARKTKRTERRKLYGSQLLLMGEVGQKFIIDHYSPMEDKWVRLVQHHTKIDVNGTVLHGEELILVGTDHIDSLDLKRGILEQVATFADLRTGDYAIAILNDIVYIVGGHYYYNSNNTIYTSLKTVKRFNLETVSWISDTYMAKGRACPGVIVAEGKLYVIGGSNSSGTLSITECYDPSIDAWSRKANLHRERKCALLATAAGYIYAFGGYKEEYGWVETVERYDIGNNCWTIIETGMNELNCIALSGDYIFSIAFATNRFKCYNIETGEWTERADIRHDIREYEIMAVPQNVFEALFSI